MSAVLITGGRIVTAVDDYEADVLLVDGKIESIGRSLNVPDAETHDASGRLVMPGGVDVHVHMETPMGGGIETCDTFASGTRSAAFGGTTTIVDFAQQFQRRDLPKQALDRRLESAAEKQCVIDYGFPLHPDGRESSRRSAELPSMIVNNDGVSSCKALHGVSRTCPDGRRCRHLSHDAQDW